MTDWPTDWKDMEAKSRELTAMGRVYMDIGSDLHDQAFDKLPLVVTLSMKNSGGWEVSRDKDGAITVSYVDYDNVRVTEPRSFEFWAIIVREHWNFNRLEVME